MAFEKRANLLRKGDHFRGWLVKTLGERIQGDRHDAAVFEPSPHLVPFADTSSSAKTSVSSPSSTLSPWAGREIRSRLSYG